MPTYDYACEACGHQFEEFQNISDGALKKCPECGKLKLKRLIGAGAGFIFKGSGFYITDYRSQEYKDRAAAESKSSDSKDGKGQKSEKKTETKSSSSTEKPAKSSGSGSSKKSSSD